MESGNIKSHTSVKRKLKELLGQLKILTPGAMVRWDVLAAMIEILIDNLTQGMDYYRCWIRPWELKEYEIKPTMAHNTIRILFELSVVSALDKRISARALRKIPPEVQISNEGIEAIRSEIEIWGEIFKLTKGFILERHALQVLGQRLDELNRLIKRPNEK